jgi:hypothetical protein
VLLESIPARTIGKKLGRAFGNSRFGVTGSTPRACSRGRLKPLKAAIEVALQVLDVLEADAEADCGTAGREARRGAGGGAIEGKGEAFVAAPGIAETEQLEPVEESRDGRLRGRFQHNRKEAR